MNARQASEKLADNATLQVLARLSMLSVPLLLGAIWFFGSTWLEQRFSAQAAFTQGLAVQVDGLEDEFAPLRERVVKLETNQERGRSDREQFQQQMIVRMDNMQNAILELSKTVAALNATVQQQRPARN